MERRRTLLILGSSATVLIVGWYLGLVFLIGDETLELEGLCILDALGFGGRVRMPVHLAVARAPGWARAEEILVLVGACTRVVSWVCGFGPCVDSVYVEEDIDDC